MRFDLPFRGSDALAAGHLTRGRLRGPAFRRVGPDTYVAADAPDDLHMAVRAALVRHPDAAVVGTTAAVLWGVVATEDLTRPGLSGREPVELALDAGGVRPVAGVRVRRDRLDAAEVVEHDGLSLSGPVRTAFDVARRLPTVDAVVVLEAFARRHGVTTDDLRRLAREHPHERGLDRLAVALPLTEEDAASAFESRVRLGLVTAGVRAPVVGHVVTDETGALRGVLDLAWPEERCAVLCDRELDTARLMAGVLVQDGWTVQRASRERWASRPDLVIEDVGHMLGASRRKLGLDRRAELRAIMLGSRPRRRKTTIRTYS